MANDYLEDLKVSLDDTKLIEFFQKRLEIIEEMRAKTIFILKTLTSKNVSQKTDVPKTAKIVRKPLQDSVVDTVLELSTIKGSPVGTDEILTHLEQNNVKFGGGTNPKTRIFGILARELKMPKPRIEKTGRGMFAKKV